MESMQARRGPIGDRADLPNQRSATSIDGHVGSRLRLRRLEVGMSQEKLAEALGVTFQQVQKYERGVNRIGASRLHQIAQALQVPISFFFEGADDEPTDRMPGAAGRCLTGPVSDPATVRLLRAFSLIQDPEIRLKAVTIIEAIAGSADRSSQSLRN